MNRFVMRAVQFTIFVAPALLILSTPAPAFQVKGLKTPESFIADLNGNGYFISNIDGKPTDKDNNGFISKLDNKGKLIKLKFVEGGRNGVTLHAPKGLAVIGDILYVTDIDSVRGFNKETGDLVHDLDLTGFGAKFLNDLTHDSQGTLYVTDMTANMILRIETGDQNKASVVIKDKDLNGPNGIVFDAVKGRLIVVTWDSGAILEVTPDGKMEVLLNSKGLKNLDGVALDEAGNLYVSSFTDGRIYKISPDFKKVRIFREGLTTPADINLDLVNRMVLIPFFDADRASTERFR